VLETGLDETLRGIAAAVPPFAEMSETGMEATRRALAVDGVVCLDELTRRATGFGCFVCANPALAFARVKMVRMNTGK
jgi:hypothetical protein